MRYFVAGAMLFLTVFGGSAPAADVSGSWKLSYTRENGQTHESTLVLKVEGEKVSGTLSSPRGSAPISDGKLSGNDISFTMVRRGNGDEITVSYTGKIEGDTMKLQMQYGGIGPVSITARRVP